MPEFAWKILNVTDQGETIATMVVASDSAERIAQQIKDAIKDDPDGLIAVSIEDPQTFEEVLDQINC